jgi:hypothetical protein
MTALLPFLLVAYSASYYGGSCCDCPDAFNAWLVTARDFPTHKSLIPVTGQLGAHLPQTTNTSSVLNKLLEFFIPLRPLVPMRMYGRSRTP